MEINYGLILLALLWTWVMAYLAGGWSLLWETILDGFPEGIHMKFEFRPEDHF